MVALRFYQSEFSQMYNRWPSHDAFKCKSLEKRLIKRMNDEQCDSDLRSSLRVHEGFEV